MAAWAARRTVLAGVLLGLAVATKFYPLLFFGPLLLLCLRAGRMRAFWTTTGSAAVAWLVVNLPVAVAAPMGWGRFYGLSESRPADWGSVWYFFETEHWPFAGSLTGGSLNLFAAAVFAVGCVLIAALILTAPRRPRVPQVFFLVLAVFLLSNKVWSPQYVIWLVPLVVLARPRVWAYVVWQVAEVTYFFAIWAYLITIATAPARCRWPRAASARESTSPRCCPGSSPCLSSWRSWSGTSWNRTLTWCAWSATTTRPVVCLMAPPTASCCASRGPSRSAREALPQPGDVGGRVGGL